MLSNSNVNTVPHYLLSSVMEREVHENSLNEHFKNYSELVLKPTRGSRGEGIARVSNSKDSLNHINNNFYVSWAASPFINIQREIRLVILEQSILIAYEKYDPVIINGLKMYNLNLGAKAKKISLNDVDNSHIELAKNAMKTIGLKLGAVDIIVNEQDDASVLEINSAFSLEHFALSTPEDRLTVLNFYEDVIEHLFVDA